MAGANALGLDYGATVDNVESIKTARLNREIGRNALDNSQANNIDQQEARGMRAAVIAGEPNAVNDYVTFDPAGAASFMDTLSGMDAAKLAETQRGIETMGRTASFVLGSDDPQTAWANVRGQLPPEIQSQLPEQYSEQMARWLLAQATDMSTMIENANSTAAPAADGQPIKSADSNSIARAVGNLFGGTYTQTADGSFVFTGLAKGEEARAAAVNSEAAKIYRTTSGISHAESVQQAAAQFGFTFPVSGGTGEGGPIAPAPRDPAQRQTGSIYLAPAGARGSDGNPLPDGTKLRWNGTNFEVVQ